MHPLFERIARELGFLTPELLRRITETGTLHGVKEVPENLRRLFITAHEIDVEAHLEVQAAFQRHTDNAVGKTVNLPADATVEDVRRAYMLAYELGVKGVTVFRDRSRSTQVLETGTWEVAVTGCSDPRRPRRGCHLLPRVQGRPPTRGQLSPLPELCL